MKDFEETQGLSREQLQDALANGDERDRVFAIWALALRSTSAVSITDHLRGEPDPGVRRALAVVLASHGEIDLLVAMSRHDPNVHVRASAMQIVMRFAAAERVPWSLVLERLTDAPEVRAAILSQIETTSPRELHDAVLAGLRDEVDLIRRESFETCARLAHAGAVDMTIPSDVVAGAKHEERAHLLAKWFAIEAPDVMCSLLAPAPFEVRHQALLMYPELAKTALRPLLDDVELYQQLEKRFELQLADASLAVVLGLTVRNAWRLDCLRECTVRLSNLERIPDELRSLASALRIACIHPEQQAIADGEMVAVDDDEELEDDWHDDYGTTAMDYAAVRQLLDRLL